MGDDKARALLKQLPNRLIDAALGSWIEMRRGFIQNNQARVFQENARKSQKLRLPGRKSGAPGTNLALQPCRKCSVPIGQTQEAQRRDDLRVGDGAVKKGQVIA